MTNDCRDTNKPNWNMKNDSCNILLLHEAYQLLWAFRLLLSTFVFKVGGKSSAVLLFSRNKFGFSTVFSFFVLLVMPERSCVVITEKIRSYIFANFDAIHIKFWNSYVKIWKLHQNSWIQVVAKDKRKRLNHVIILSQLNEKKADTNLFAFDYDH